MGNINPYGVAGGIEGILAALEAQGYTPPGQAGANLGGMFGSAFGAPPPGAALGAAFGSALGGNAPPVTGAGMRQFGPGQMVTGGNMNFMGLTPQANVYTGGMNSASGQNAYGPPAVRHDPNASAPVSAPHAREPGRAPSQQWAGGFGMSDGSAWGNKGDAAMMSRGGINGSLKEQPGQSMNAASGGFQNGILPGAGSVFGLGGSR